MDKNVKEVKFFVIKKGLIKFSDSDNAYFISDKVKEVSDFGKYPIVGGDKCEVTIEKIKNAEGNEEEMVTFLRKVTKETKKEEIKEVKKEEVVVKKEEAKVEPKKEEAKTDSNGEIKVLTVEAVYNNESIKFKEEKINGKKWCPLSENLKKQNIQELGFKANNIMTLNIVNGIIVGVADVKSVKSVSTSEKRTEETKEKTNSANSYSNSNYSSDKNDSIERQCALKGAVEIVKSLIEAKEIDKKIVKDVILDLTKVCYEAIQNV